MSAFQLTVMANMTGDAEAEITGAQNIEDALMRMNAEHKYLLGR